MMAKPKHGRCNNACPATTRPNHIHRTHPPRFPSPAVLSALAVIATAPPAVAGPLPTPPPSFLCPFIECDNVPLSLSSRATPSSSTSPPPSTTTQTQCGAVADKYVQGPDSLWRKTNSWSLYGSTCWSGSAPSTSAVQSQPSSSQTPVPTSTPSAVEFDTSVLPAGWDNVSGVSSTTGSTTILALAIVLASSICIFMIGCVFWRRRKKKARDIERKLAHKRGAHDDSQDNGREKDVRGKMRMWAKASARWKSNIRQSARRRRKRHMSSSMLSRPLSPTLSDSPQPSVVAPSAPSRRGSVASEEPDPSRPCLNDNVTEPSVTLHHPPRSVSPPTYGASFVPVSHLPPSTTVSSLDSTTSLTNPRSAQPSNQPSRAEDEPLPYLARSDGHIATDDKSQLAYIRELASFPPTVASASAMQSVSAPEWHEVEDDDLEDLDADLSEQPPSFHNCGLPPSFPPPPSKADIHLPFCYLDDHLRYSEEIGIPVSPPVTGLPGLSLGASPSAPPINDPGLEPSAPSLESEDELFQDWDEASPYAPEASTSVDLDPVPDRAIESPISSTISSSSHACSPSTRESVARGGTLPRYHP